VQPLAISHCVGIKSAGGLKDCKPVGNFMQSRIAFPGQHKLTMKIPHAFAPLLAGQLQKLVKPTHRSFRDVAQKQIASAKCVFLDQCVCVLVRAGTHTHTHTRTCTRTHTHIHTYTHRQVHTHSGALAHVHSSPNSILKHVNDSMHTQESTKHLCCASVHCVNSQISSH